MSSSTLATTLAWLRTRVPAGHFRTCVRDMNNDMTRDRAEFFIVRSPGFSMIRALLPEPLGIVPGPFEHRGPSQHCTRSPRALHPEPSSPPFGAFHDEGGYVAGRMLSMSAGKAQDIQERKRDLPRQLECRRTARRVLTRGKVDIERGGTSMRGNKDGGDAAMRGGCAR